MVFCPCEEAGGGTEVDALFNNELMIDKEHFILFVEDECTSDGVQSMLIGTYWKEKNVTIFDFKAEY